MLRSVLLLLALVALAYAQAGLNVTCVNKGMSGSFYDLSFPLLNGTEQDFSAYKGKVVIVSNMASF